LLPTGRNAFIRSGASLSACEQYANAFVLLGACLNDKGSAMSQRMECSAGAAGPIYTQQAYSDAACSTPSPGELYTFVPNADGTCQSYPLGSTWFGAMCVTVNRSTTTTTTAPSISTLLYASLDVLFVALFLLFVL
jgi:hypothetical protein